MAINKRVYNLIEIIFSIIGCVLSAYMTYLGYINVFYFGSNYGWILVFFGAALFLFAIIYLIMFIVDYWRNCL
jgi:hypothetical protein